MVDPRRVASAFAKWGLEVTTVEPASLEGCVSVDSARRVLVHVGIPERIGGCVTLHDFSQGAQTVAQMVQNPAEKVQQDAGNLVFLGDGEGLFLLDGDTGEVWVWNESLFFKVNTSLANFVEFLVLIQEELNALGDLEDVDDGQHDNEIVLSRLIGKFRRVDASAIEQAEEYWRRTVVACLHSVAL
ncbi:SUKH-4 family immunity protein [Streptomyces sp. NPDC007083]|uniref:SUKH-4 family immunity protein n=1 Tax=Streptomyces sp. NPDC007083 TaxID=3156913 RepID=UPI0033D0CF1D